MLTELVKVQQRPGEPQRQWFQSRDEDLIVWFAGDGSVLGFQLCYDRSSTEKAFIWMRGKGFSHDKVDDGEGGGGMTYKRTPILVPYLMLEQQRSR